MEDLEGRTQEEHRPKAVNMSTFVPSENIRPPEINESEYKSVDYVNLKKLPLSSILAVQISAYDLNYKMKIVGKPEEKRVRIWVEDNPGSLEGPIDQIGYSDLIGKGDSCENGALKVGSITSFPYFNYDREGNALAPKDLEDDAWIDTIIKIMVRKD